MGRGAYREPEVPESVEADAWVRAQIEACIGESARAEKRRRAIRFWVRTAIAVVVALAWITAGALALLRLLPTEVLIGMLTATVFGAVMIPVMFLGASLSPQSPGDRARPSRGAGSN